MGEVCLRAETRSEAGRSASREASKRPLGLLHHLRGEGSLPVFRGARSTKTRFKPHTPSVPRPPQARTAHFKRLYRK